MLDFDKMRKLVDELEFRKQELDDNPDHTHVKLFRMALEEAKVELIEYISKV